MFEQVGKGADSGVLLSQDIVVTFSVGELNVLEAFISSNDVAVAELAQHFPLVNEMGYLTLVCGRHAL
jgi:hypothetical protein